MSDITLTIGGMPYRLSNFTAEMQQEFCDWSKTVLYDPVRDVLAYIKDIPEKLQKDLLNDAFRRKSLRGSVTDPDLDALEHSFQGITKIYQLMFRKHHPNLTERDIANLMNQAHEELGEEGLEEVFGIAKGKFPLDGTASGGSLPQTQEPAATI